MSNLLLYPILYSFIHSIYKAIPTSEGELCYTDVALLLLHDKFNDQKPLLQKQMDVGGIFRSIIKYRALVIQDPVLIIRVYRRPFTTFLDDIYKI